jgi:hemoglobin-like flavoprotein
MTPKQIALVQSTWQQVLSISDAAACIFYERLFKLDPSMRILFKDDMGEQRRKLIAMLTAVVNSLQRFDTLVPAIEDLGRRHARYGVQDRHYAIVGVALLGTLEQGLPNDFTADVRDAWNAAYALVARTMKQATLHETARLIQASNLDTRTAV